MATFRQRLVSRRELFLVFSVCAFPIYSWAILNFLERAPGWLFYLSMGEVFGILGYTLSVALVESLLLLLGLLVLAVVLPKGLFRDRFVATGTLVVVLLTLASIGVHLVTGPLARLPTAVTIAILVLFAAILAGAVYFFAKRREWLGTRLHSFAERVSILTFIYVPLSLVAILVVLFRNL